MLQKGLSLVCADHDDWPLCLGKQNDQRSRCSPRSDTDTHANDARARSMSPTSCRICDTVVLEVASTKRLDSFSGDPGPTASFRFLLLSRTVTILLSIGFDCLVGWSISETTEPLAQSSRVESRQYPIRIAKGLVIRVSRTAASVVALEQSDTTATVLIRLWVAPVDTKLPSYVSPAQTESHFRISSLTDTPHCDKQNSNRQAWHESAARRHCSVVCLAIGQSILGPTLNIHSSIIARVNCGTFRVQQYYNHYYHDGGRPFVRPILVDQLGQ